MRVLLDSHAFLWAATDDERLPPAVAELIEDAAIRVFISVATTWELTLKVMSGKLRLPSPPAEHFAEHVERFRSELLPIHQRHVSALPELPAIHGDPFDRMLVAQALVEDLDLVTGDERIRRYPVRTVW
ncbi:MAG: type II toxin-antitoxin system VapC family toxin [Actinomycetota bacterium]